MIATTMNGERVGAETLAVVAATLARIAAKRPPAPLPVEREVGCCVCRQWLPGWAEAGWRDGDPIRCARCAKAAA